MTASKNRGYNIWMFVVALGLIASCGQPSETSAFGKITGYVLDKFSETPITGAVVQLMLQQASDTTDSQGAFVLDNLEPEPETLIVKKKFYEHLSLALDIAPGSRDMTLHIVPSCAGDTLILSQQLFVKKDGQWYQVDETGKAFLVNNSVITAKFWADVSAEEIAAFHIAMGVEVLRENILGFIDLKIPDGADPLCMVLEYLSSDLVEIAEPNAYGEYLYF
ncbi:MAG: hypothetical protein GH143_06295 [Calditrichaeota bacterium]|nr:hypothetical protein [Calditrichota bacterium]